jgi:hypothetical protein
MPVTFPEGIEKVNKTEPSVGHGDECAKKTGSEFLLNVFARGDPGRQFEVRIIECLNDLIEHLQL